MLIRIRATGQTIDMIPAAALPKLQAGMAELVPEPETKEISAGFGASLRELAARFFGASKEAHV